MITAHCPECGSAAIREKNVAYAELPVTGWTLEDGELRPTDYGDASADWETEDTTNQYACRKCRWEGQLDALKVRTEDDTTDDWNRAMREHNAEG